MNHCYIIHEELNQAPPKILHFIKTHNQNYEKVDVNCNRTAVPRNIGWLCCLVDRTNTPLHARETHHP